MAGYSLAELVLMQASRSSSHTCTKLASTRNMISTSRSFFSRAVFGSSHAVVVVLVLVLVVVVVVASPVSVA